MIGGTGPKKTMRMVAQYADACNIGSWVGRENMQKAINALKAQCEVVERNYDTIEKTSLSTVHLSGNDTVESIMKTLKDLSEMGFTHVIFNMPDVYTITPLETFAEKIMPEAAGL
jgi:alkanesulfonate monooxygenase